MIVNWGYILLNNMAYWKPFLPISCEAIRIKLQILNYLNWILNFPPANAVSGFKIALFILTTLSQLCLTLAVTQMRVQHGEQQAW